MPKCSLPPNRHQLILNTLAREIRAVDKTVRIHLDDYCDSHVYYMEYNGRCKGEIEYRIDLDTWAINNITAKHLGNGWGMKYIDAFFKVFDQHGINRIALIDNINPTWWYRVNKRHPKFLLEDY